MAGEKKGLMKEFIQLGKQIFQDKEVKDYDQLVEDKKDLEEKLAAKTAEYDAKIAEVTALHAAADDRVAKAEAAADERATKAEADAANRISDSNVKVAGLIEEFQTRYNKWNLVINKESNLESRIAELTLELTKANAKAETAESSITKLQGELSEQQNLLTKTEDELSLAKKELSSRVRELKGTVGELQKVEAQMEEHKREIGLEYPVIDDLSNNFRALSNGCHRMAKRFFKTELPPEFFTNDLYRQLESSGFIKLAPRKIPLSNSMASQCLRMATAERVIAEKLSVNIFRQYYLPHSTPSRELIDDITKRLDKRNSVKEAVFRLQLLSAYEQDEQNFITSLVKMTTADVVKILDPLLCIPGMKEEFQSALTKLFEEAVKLWKSIQRSATKACVTNDPEYRRLNNEDETWDINEEYDTAIGLTNEQMSQIPQEVEPLIPLFPMVTIGKNIISPGCALWSDQNSVVAASIEFAHMNSRSSPGRWMVRRESERRRLSSSGSQRKPEDPSKPPLSPSAGYHSFLAESRPGSRKPSPPLRRATPPVATPPASPPPTLQTIEVGAD
ncbi:hypothetical protein EG329_001428 [Mollisiaceae sp. DMI_Dod_QoI]|nr:hypothetical protein EG329_001428 [Helotiales sp. DMI_Dod_QoI]